MKQQAVVLLGRGGYSKAPKEQMARLVRRLEYNNANRIVVGAFVDQATPSLPQALVECADSGAKRILVVPMYVPDDRNLGKWMLKVIGRWVNQRVSSEIQVRMSPPLADHEAIAGAVEQMASNWMSGEFISPSVGNSEIGEPEWSVIPPHKFHLLQCRGPRCTARGAGDVWNHLNGRLVEEKMLDKDVLVAQTGCLYPCNLGPVMVVYPEGNWYCSMNNEVADRVLEEHLRGGEVVLEYALQPAPHAQRAPDMSI